MFKKNTTIFKPNFITIEGGEGSGKSTQIKKIKAWFYKKKIPICLTREPGGSIQSEIIRNIIFNNKINKWDCISEYLLISTARRQHLKQIIWPALSKGKWVICDRFYDSSIVYQGYAHGIPIDFLNMINQQISNKFEPDITIVMKTNIKTSIQRTKCRQIKIKKNYYENMNIKFHRKLEKGYDKLIQKNPHRFIQINADLSIYDVWKNIKHNLKKKFYI